MSRAETLDLAAPAAAWLRPSDYTGQLIHALHGAGRPLVRGAVLELGCGSGVVLAALAGLGAESLVGTDIEPLAIRESRALLAGLAQPVELLLGDLWAPVAGRRFDLIVANLPHLPTTTAAIPGRLPSWSLGGADGRRLVDPFLRGLPAHLRPGGRAVMVHSGFLGIAGTQALLATQGQAAQPLHATLIHLAPEKRAVVTAAVLDRPGAALRLGGHVFLPTEILEIGAAGEIGAADRARPG